MQIVRNEDEELKLLNDMHKAMWEPDRAQPSVSGMIYCLTKTYYENNMVLPNPDGSIPVHRNKEQLLLFASGLGLEKVLLYGRQNSEKGEFEGIQWHVDHIGDDNTFYEIKSTRARTLRPDEPLSQAISEGWHKQILAYFKVCGITEGKLAVLHLMGNYRPPFPDIRVYELSATQEEIDENWTWIKQRAVTYLKFVKENTMPEPFQYNMEFECKYCNWNALCTARKEQTDRESKSVREL